MSGQWPFPDDSPVARARKVAIAYREHLMVANPTLCAAVDDAMLAYGQAWVAPAVELHDEDDLLTPNQAAEMLSITLGALRQYRLRGRLHGVKTVDGWRYRALDVRSLPIVRLGRPTRAVAQAAA